MKAISFSEYGTFDVLRLSDIEKPQPKKNEVSVKIHTTSINDWEVSLISGKPLLYRLLYGIFSPKITIPGIEIAGVVEDTGQSPGKFAAGDRVFCDLSDVGLGGFAEYICVPEDILTTMPPEMNFIQAAAIPHASLLAWQGLVNIGKIKEGESVLINGAGGGVGTLALQIAKIYNCKVTGVDSELKLAALKNMGFDQVIDYKKNDFVDSDEKYDLILDAKTTRSPFRHLKALKKGGRYVTVGGDLSRLIQLLFLKNLLNKLTGNSQYILALKPNENLEQINRLFNNGLLLPVIDRVYKLEEAATALTRFNEAKHIGKIVISVAE